MTKGTKKILTILISFYLVFSCTPQQRLSRLLAKHPSLKENVSDTLILHDSVIVPNVVHDTTTIFEYHDSIVIVNNEKVYAQYIFDTITKEIHHHIECKGDTITIIKEIPFEVEKIKYMESNDWRRYIPWGIFIMISIIVLAFIKQIKSLFN